MAVVLDPYGVQWSVRRKWWPFPDVFDIVDLAFFGWIGVVIALPFVLLWPFWVMTKFLGAHWVIRIDRGGVEVGRELVRGWSRSRGRITEIATKVASGEMSGLYRI